jgi:hypothetical protein
MRCLCSDSTRDPAVPVCAGTRQIVHPSCPIDHASPLLNGTVAISDAVGETIADYVNANTMQLLREQQ